MEDLDGWNFSMSLRIFKIDPKDFFFKMYFCCLILQFPHCKCKNGACKKPKMMNLASSFSIKNSFQALKHRRSKMSAAPAPDSRRRSSDVPIRPIFFYLHWHAPIQADTGRFAPILADILQNLPKLAEIYVKINKNKLVGCIPYIIS